MSAIEILNLQYNNHCFRNKKDRDGEVHASDWRRLTVFHDFRPGRRLP